MKPAPRRWLRVLLATAVLALGTPLVVTAQPAAAQESPVCLASESPTVCAAFEALYGVMIAAGLTNTAVGAAIVDMREHMSGTFDADEFLTETCSDPSNYGGGVTVTPAMIAICRAEGLAAAADVKHWILHDSALARALEGVLGGNVFDEAENAAMCATPGLAQWLIAQLCGGGPAGDSPAAFVNAEPPAAWTGPVSEIPRIGGYSDMGLTTAPWAVDFIVRPVAGRTPVDEWVELYRGEYEPQPWRYYTAVQFRVDTDMDGLPQHVEFRLCGKLDAEWDTCETYATTAVDGWGHSVAWGIWHGAADASGSLIAGPTGVSEGGAVNWYAHQLFAKTDRVNVIGDDDEAANALGQIYPGGGGDYAVITWTQFQEKFGLFGGNEDPLGDVTEAPGPGEWQEVPAPPVPDPLPDDVPDPPGAPTPNENVDPGADEAGLFDILGNRIGGFFDNLASGIGSAFNWLGDIFGRWIKWLAQVLRTLFGGVVDLLQWLGHLLQQGFAGLLGLLQLLYHAVTNGLGLVVAGVSEVFRAIGDLPHAFGDLLHDLFVPEDADITFDECDHSLCGWLPALGEATIDFSGHLGELAAGSCTAPSIGWGTGGAIESFRVSVPPPTGCASGAHTAGGSYPSEAGDLFGWRVLMRLLCLAVFVVWYVREIIRMTPWAEHGYWAENPTQLELFDQVGRA